ncbi:MAG: hypothetical protein K0S08_2209 [Gammaproteobacteria bacterium]|jgi:hypothetical protein|nr:hypothetical protein [Gammaproteobacteria bacterium]
MQYSSVFTSSDAQSTGNENTSLVQRKQDSRQCDPCCIAVGTTGIGSVFGFVVATVVGLYTNHSLGNSAVYGIPGFFIGSALGCAAPFAVKAIINNCKKKDNSSSDHMDPVNPSRIYQV